jgi:CRP-like cAMP-binding protein
VQPRYHAAVSADGGRSVPATDAQHNHSATRTDCRRIRLGDAGDTPWTRRALRQADVVLLLATSDSDPSPTALEQSLLGKAGLGDRARCELVMFQDGAAMPVAGTLAWTQGRRLDRRHLVRRDNPADWARLAVQLAGISDVPPWLKKNELVSGLDDDQLRLLHAQLVWMHLGGQDLLFTEGSPGDGLFLIVSGRLQAIQTATGGEERILREMGPGELLGEIALITGESRTATARAVRDSTVAKLSKTSFELLAKRNPALMLQLAQIIVNRLIGRSSQKQETGSFNVTIVSLDQRVDSTHFTESLHRGFSLLGKTALLNAESVESRLGRGKSACIRERLICRKRSACDQAMAPPRIRNNTGISP